jgi:hypothetical protein
MQKVANCNMDTLRVRMVRCIAEEPQPPANPVELELWCEAGKSGRPVQTHVGEEGIVLWVNDDRTACVAFDDGDERVLFMEEILCIQPPGQPKQT